MKTKNIEETIKDSLKKNCSLNLSDYVELAKNTEFNFGVAVSGGADSVCLLISLCNILHTYKIPLKVITVNHFIRPDEETCGDVDFVENLCNSLKSKGYNISFFKEELRRGYVKEVAEERKMGIEEAARFLRYEAFEKFMNRENINYIFLAHNKNDFYETVLMRFLQGASCDSSTGISYKRGKYLRPMLDIERSDIESYLKEKNQVWRTDSTNFDTLYLRNKIRSELMPFLNNNFTGWKTAVEKGALKAEYDRDFISDYIEKFNYLDESTGNVRQYSIDANQFLCEKRAVQIRLLLKLSNLISENSRIPFNFLNDVCDSLENAAALKNGINLFEKQCEKKFADLQYFWYKNRVCVKKEETVISEYCFSDIITDAGIYEYDWGSLEVKACERVENLFTFELKYKSGKTDILREKLPYQLVINKLK